jgi:hypothetical protein
MDHRYCTGCGRAFAMGTWQKESFCGSCGWPLKQLMGREPMDVHPGLERPRRLSRGVPAGLSAAVSEASAFAGQHPYVFGTGTVVAGVGALMLAPALLTLGSGVMVAGCIIVALGLLSAFSGGEKDAGNMVMAGILILGAGAGITLVGNIIAVAGVIAIVAGCGVATKAAVEDVLRQRIKAQLRQKNVSELVDLSRRLSN